MRFWNNLYRLLGEADIPREDIFVTNVHPTLLEGRDPRRHISRSSAGKDWFHRCDLFLRAQIREMAPRLVVTLGAAPRRFVSRRFDVALERELDCDEIREPHRVPVTAIRHPSAAQSRERRSETARVLWRVSR